MGVHGLWDLLAPVGRRVSVETLAGKRLAIDASIWMIQFMKAMRDEKGEMVRNAHLLGFFRRICKLLYLRTKPIFVFDGGTPALKRRTVIARRRQRENAQAKIRKTAEKLLLNQLKQIRLKELADELEKQRKNNDAKCQTVFTSEELEKQSRSDDAKGKKVITDEADVADKMSGGSCLYADRYNQEAVDEMLAASLLVEEDEVLTVGESSSGLRAQDEEEDADEDEEMILPTMHGKVDPAILAALPPSMQLDLLVQMRERLMAENRQKYQKVKKVPARFSELQIQAYLKTVAFRREIDEVQKSAAGQGIGGVKTSRIASEANREFIFSSSFSGDKQVLTSAGEGRRTSNASLPTATSSANTVGVTLKKSSSTASESAEVEPQMDLDNDIETYLDERGRLRVSKVRAMGIRMTRDIQRNLDLMKEIDRGRGAATENAKNESTTDRSEVEALADTPNGIRNSDHNTDGITSIKNKNEETALNTGCSIEISFENNGDHEFGADADDDLFARLVASDPVLDFSVDNSLPKKQCSDSTSECEWEEGSTLGDGIKVDHKLLVADGGMNDDNELDWEEGGDFAVDVKVDKSPVADGGINQGRELERDEGGTLGNDIKMDSKLLVEGSSDIQEESSSCPVECRKIPSKGALEEESDFQEAIRRSLQDLEDQRSLDTLCKHGKSRAAAEMSLGGTDTGFLRKEDPNKPEVSSECKFEEQHPVPEHAEGIGSTVEGNISETNNPLEGQLTPPLVNCDDMEVVTEKTCQSYPNEELLMHDASEERNLQQEVLVESVTKVQEKHVSQITEQLTYTSGSGGDLNGFDAAMDGHSSETTVLGKDSVNDLTKGMDTAQAVEEEEAGDYISMEKEEPFHKSASLDGKKKQIEVTEASLEEEMLILGEEERELGDEQRKLERNAESVSNEMFAECQELLQIFGLPFIIAPMEAEAQCAYMELANLVDGVVTDDSDAFLFGARSVYKNIFDDRKYVETYFMKDIENELGLNREKLINMALLLGSDYTEGVSGIGIVNAIEVVNAFPEEDGLRKFREWIESPDPSILGKYEAEAGGNSRKRESKVGDTDMSCSDSKGVDETQKIKQIFMDKHRNVSKNWHIPSSFPSDAVISAYTSPQVDKSTEPFSWGMPDHFILRKLCWEKFGWITQKADELLLPVLKEYNKRETQLRLEAFYTFNERFAKIRSKRIKKALKGMTWNKSLDLMDEPGPRSKKRIVNQGDAIGEESEKALEGRDFGDAGNEPNGTEKSIEKKSRKKRAQRESLHAVGSNKRSSTEAESCQNQNEGLIVRCKGRGRGKGRNESIGKRRKKTGSPLKYAESSSSDESNSDDGHESQVKFEGQCQVRRSERPRKKVNYTMSDSIYDGFDQDDGNSKNENLERRASTADLLDAGDSVTSPSKINRSEIVDQELSQECLEKGALFCTDKSAPETRVTESSSSKNDDILAGAQLSNDYLTIGGGFCLDEDDAKVDSGGLASPTRAAALDSDLPNHSSFLDNRNCTNNPSQSINSPSGTLDRVQQEESLGRVDTSDTKQNADDTTDNNDCSLVQKIPFDGDDVNESVRSLRAMPNLRRKRRKS